MSFLNNDNYVNISRLCTSPFIKYIYERKMSKRERENGAN